MQSRKLSSDLATSGDSGMQVPYRLFLEARTSARDVGLIVIASPAFVAFAQLFFSITVDAVAVLITISPVCGAFIDV